MIKTLRKPFPPKIHQYLALKYLSSNLKTPLTLALSSLKKKDNRVEKRDTTDQVNPTPKIFFSSIKCHGPSETTTCVKSQTDCSEPQKTVAPKNLGHYRFHQEVEAALNQQINQEFKAFYNYLSMAAYFGQSDVALPGCESFFMQLHHEEHEHALKLINYIRLRGGKVNLCGISPPQEVNWKSPLDALKIALELEVAVTDHLYSVAGVAEEHRDLNTSDFIITNFLGEQMKSIDEMTRLITTLTNVGDQGLSQFIFDRDLLKTHIADKFNVLKNQKPCEKY